MLASHAALLGSTGKSAMAVFHTLSAGNIGQLGAPGTGVPAEAVVGDTPTARPSHITPAATNATGPAILCRRTNAPSLRAATVPDTGLVAGQGQRTDNANDEAESVVARPVSVSDARYYGGNTAGRSRMRRAKVGVNRPSPQGRSGSLAIAWLSTPTISVDTT